MTTVPLVTVGTTVTELVAASAERIQVTAHNATSGAVVRADEDRELVATSGNIIYYQDTLIFRGPIARKRLWVVSDTAATSVYYTEV